MNFSGISSNSNLLDQINRKQENTFEQLASGKKVNKAADDVSAQLIIERLSSQSNGYQQSVRNAYDGISYAQVAESTLSGISDSANRIQELTYRAGSGILSDSDKQAIQSEIDLLKEGIQDSISNSNFAGKPIFGSEGSADFQIGANAGQTLSVGNKDIAAQLESFGLADIDVTQAGGVDAALASLEDIGQFLGEEQGSLGAIQNQFQSAANQLAQTDVNVQAARARLADTDYAQASAQQAQNDVQSQSANIVAGASRQQAESVLNLLS
jgi:flagellin